MSDQDPMRDVEKAIEALWSINLDTVKEAIRQQAIAEARDEIRQEIIDEIRAELQDAVDAAESDEAPEIGAEGDWGQDEAAGLRAFLTLFDQNW